MTSAQDVETSLITNSPPEDSFLVGDSHRGVIQQQQQQQQQFIGIPTYRSYYLK